MLENYNPVFVPQAIYKEVEILLGTDRKTDIEAYLRKHIPLEKYYQRKVMEGIKKAYPSAFVRKISVEVYNMAGIPDVMAIVEGHYFGFEIKRPLLGVLSPIQKKTIEEICRAGGVATVVSYPEEAVAIIEEKLKL